MTPEEHAIAVVGVGAILPDSPDAASFWSNLTDGHYAINPTGSAALARAGTGDVKAGMIRAQIAQGHDAWCSTQAAVWLHGRGAEGVGDIGLLADEVAGRAVEALRRLRAGLTG